jgi:diguanylate cyclase (GGDEF)-like protein
MSAVMIAAEKSGKPTMPESAALKLLVVEDSKMTREVVCNYLAKIGLVNAQVADTGHAALEIFRTNRPDIVVLDAILPDIDGFAVAQQMRALEVEGEWSAILFLTSKNQDDQVEQGIQMGGDDYLTKPVSETLLKAKVKAMCRLVDMQRRQMAAARQTKIANTELQRLCTTDGLTGIANRRSFDEMAEREWRRCLRAVKPLSFVILDVDHFKQYNDTYGHLAGDECLKTVAAEIARAAPRATDLVARYGGEEFSLVLGDTDGYGALKVAHRIRLYIAQLQIPHGSSVSPFVTVSGGVCGLIPGESLTLETSLRSADHALYTAKAQGRDRIVRMDYGQVG